MSDSIAGILGKKVKWKVGEKTYEISPMNLGILSDAESEIISRQKPVKEQIEGIAPLASVMPDYVREQADLILARSKSIPPGEVLQWVSSEPEGIVWSLTRQLKESVPEAFESGELTEKMIRDDVYSKVESNFKKLMDEVSERNQASELEDTPKNPSGPSQSGQEEAASQPEANQDPS